MATINGCYVRLLKEEGKPVGKVSNWREDGDWCKVTTAEGVTYMVHCSDPKEYLGRLKPETEK